MEKYCQKGFTLIELLVVVAVVGIIAAIAIPGLLRARMSGNEASAIGGLRAILSSQHSYAASCGNGFYAESLLVLGDPPPDSHPFISPDLTTAATITKSGYSITMDHGSEAVNAATDGCNSLGVAASLFSSFYVTANPTALGTTGTRYFWTNALDTIYENPEAAFESTVGNAPPGAGSALQ